MSAAGGGGSPSRSGPASSVSGPTGSTWTPPPDDADRQFVVGDATSSVPGVIARLDSRIAGGALRGVELFERPPSDGIVAAGEEIGDVSVEALDADPGSADAARRSRTGVVGVDLGVALGPVALVERGEFVRGRSPLLLPSRRRLLRGGSRRGRCSAPTR